MAHQHRKWLYVPKRRWLKFRDVTDFNPELIFSLFYAVSYITAIKRAELSKIRCPEARVQENYVFYSKSVQQRLNKTWLIISVFCLAARSNCLLLKSSAFANLKLICPKMKQNICQKNSQWMLVKIYKVLQQSVTCYSIRQLNSN